jgi:hypothetical protein
MGINDSIEESEIKRGVRLGRGAFSDVYRFRFFYSYLKYTIKK